MARVIIAVTVLTFVGGFAAAHAAWPNRAPLLDWTWH